MKKFIVLFVALIVASAGTLALSSCSPKQSENDIVAIAFLQKDRAGNDLFTVEIVENESNAQLTVEGPALPNANIIANLDKKSYSNIQKALSKQEFNTWTSLSEGQTMPAPAGGFAMVVQRRDGTVLGATSVTLSPEAIDLMSGQISDVVTDLVLDRLGVDLGILDFVM